MNIKNKKALTTLLWIFQGILVGFGAIMPGISGGTLCVAFGMYLPIIKLVSHPIKNLSQYGKMLFIFAIGVGLGFVGLSGLAGWLMNMSSSLVTCAFIGFIIGTFPELWSDAGVEGRTQKSYWSIAVGFILMLALLIIIQKSDISDIKADFRGFVLCGILWGTSFIVPGLSSSTLLLFFGLYQPMLDGIGSIDPTVIFPLFIGIVACVATLAKGVNILYKNHYNIISHLIIGVVAATVVMIFPKWENYSGEAIYRIICIVGGAVVSYIFTRICAKIKKDS